MRPLALLLLLAGCSGLSATQVAEPGPATYIIGCNGSLNTMLDCQKKASEVCPAGYRIRGRETEDRYTASDLAGMAGRVGMRRTLMVSCAA